MSAVATIISREQHDRRSGVGASECAPIVLGVDKFGRTAADIYAAKVLDEREASSPNQALARGNLLEPAVLAWYSAETGRAPEATGAAQRTVRAKLYPWLFATPDGLLPDRVVEAKTARSREGWGDPGTDEIPIEYLIQCHSQMICTGLQLVDLPVLFGSFEFALYQVQFDAELAGLITTETGRFWSEHVIARVPPPAATGAAAETLYRRDNGAVQVATPDVLADWMRARELRASIAPLEAEAEEVVGRIKVAMGEAATLVDEAGSKLATWKNNKSSQSFDLAQFRADHPALFAQYQREKAGARVFRLSHPPKEK